MEAINLIKSINEIQDIVNFIDSIISKHKIKFILLEGEIGSGKTTLVRQLSKIWNNDQAVLSPSFNKMLVYDQFIHLDAYNMSDEDLEQFYDYFEDKFILIEWSNLLNYQFDQFIKIKIEFKDENHRFYNITWKG